jgi:hypothetical protein
LVPSYYDYEYFLSYNNENWEDFVAPAAKLLSGRQVAHWVQHHDSKRGDEIAPKVRDAIGRSMAFIVFHSRRYMESPWTRQELDWFLESRRERDQRDRKLIVFKCDSVLPAPPLSEVYYSDLHAQADAGAIRQEILRGLNGDPAVSRLPPSREIDRDIRWPQDFVGRRAEMLKIQEYFFPGVSDPLAAQAADPPATQRRLGLWAGPGFGKSSLARKFAIEHKNYFWRIHWLPAQNETVLIAKTAKIADCATDATADQIQSAFIDRFCGVADADRFQPEVGAPVLLIFDNVEKGTEKRVAALVEKLPPAVRVLTTARYENRNDLITQHLRLGQLAEDDAVSLLQSLARGVDSDAAARRLARRLHCHPLALSHAGRFCGQGRPFSEYEGKLDARLKEAPKGHEYKMGEETEEEAASVWATVSLSLDYAAGKGGGVPSIASLAQPLIDNAQWRKRRRRRRTIRDLADFLSYCNADRIPRSLYQEVGERGSVDEALAALIQLGLVYDDERFDNDPAVAMHRLVQQVIRMDADASGRSAKVIDALVPFLHRCLVEAPSVDRRRELDKYFPHLLQAIPELDAPDFRGNEAANILESVADLVVFALTNQYRFEGGEAYPERLPDLLGCFYEVDPLEGPLDYLLDRIAGRPDAEAEWRRFRDDCLKQQNYVLRFALAEALAKHAEKGAKPLDRGEIESLIVQRGDLNKFELGGYALKSLCSDPKQIDANTPKLLEEIARRSSYPSGPILGDLFLNLVYQGEKVHELLPKEGEGSQFWEPIWDLVAYDVNAIEAADLHNRKKTRSDLQSERRAVRDEFAYRKTLEELRDKLQEKLLDPTLKEVLTNYFFIGVDTSAIDKAEKAIRSLWTTPELMDLFRLLFGHPLWSVAESAANVLAKLLGKAKEENRTAECAAYVGMLERLFDRRQPWRVRYGAVEAAFLIRLDEEPNHTTFFKAVRKFYNDPISKMRGLCAENLLSIMLNAGDFQRERYERDFEKEIARWLRDTDCWPLEHVYRYFHALHARAAKGNKDRKRVQASIDRFARKRRSRLTRDIGRWWEMNRAEFLSNLDDRKRLEKGRTRSAA